MTIATKTPQKPSINNKVLYVPNPVTINSSYKQVGPTPEQQKLAHPATSKSAENIAQTQRLQKINQMNFGQAALNGKLSQNIYNSGDVGNYINKTIAGYDKTPAKQNVQQTKIVRVESNPIQSARNQLFISPVIPSKQIPQQPLPINPPVLQSFEGTNKTMKLNPSQQARALSGELELKAYPRPNGSLFFAKSEASANKLIQNQKAPNVPNALMKQSQKVKSDYLSGVMPSGTKKKQNDYVLPYTTIESTGAKSASKAKSSKSEYVQPIETALGFKELKPNQNVSLGEKIGTGLALGAAGEFEAFGNIGATGEKLATGKKELFGEWKPRESAGTLGVNAFVGSVSEGTWETLQTPFRTPEESLKKISELNARTKSQYDKAGSLIMQDPFTQIPTFAAPIISLIPESAAKVGLGVLRVAGKGLEKTTPEIIKTIGTSISSKGKTAKDKLSDNLFINYGTKSIREQNPKSTNFGELLQETTAKTSKSTSSKAPKNTPNTVWTGISDYAQKLREEMGRQKTPINKATKQSGVNPTGIADKLAESFEIGGGKLDRNISYKAKLTEGIANEKARIYKSANDPFPISAGSISESDMSMNLAQVAKGMIDPSAVSLQRKLGKNLHTDISLEDADKLIANKIDFDEFKNIYRIQEKNPKTPISNIIDRYIAQKPSKSPFDDVYGTSNLDASVKSNAISKTKKGFDPFGEQIEFTGKKEEGYFYAFKTTGNDFVINPNPIKGRKYYKIPEVKGAKPQQTIFDYANAKIKGKGGTVLSDVKPFDIGSTLTKGAKRIYDSNYAFPIIGGAAVGAGYGLSNLLSPKPETKQETKKTQKQQNDSIFAFNGQYLTGYKGELESKNPQKQREKQNPLFGLANILDQEQTPFQGTKQKPYQGTKQTPFLDTPYYPIFGSDEVPIQTPFLDQVPYRGRISPNEFLFPPMSFNLFSNPSSVSGKDSGADSDFFRVFASAKEPFGSTELPLGEFVDSSTPIFEIKDRISGSAIRKANRFGGLQNPLRAPKNIIDEDNFVGLFGFSQKKQRKSKSNDMEFNFW